MRWLLLMTLPIVAALGCGDGTTPEPGPEMGTDIGEVSDVADAEDVPEDSDGADSSDAAVDAEVDVLEDLVSDADVEVWDQSVVAVPGVCAALDRESLLSGALLDQAFYCNDLCPDPECAGLCARGVAASNGCRQCIEAATLCMIRECSCDGQDGCEQCFEESCEDEWVLCAGIAVEEPPPPSPRPAGCDRSQVGALSSPVAPNAIRECATECPATSERPECVEACFGEATGATQPCSRCISTWLGCASGCSDCVADPISADCIRCVPECVEELNECTGGLLEVQLIPPDPGRLRMLNASEAPGAALVDAADGRPIARRVGAWGVSEWSEEEVGSYRLGVTTGPVGAAAVPSATLNVSVESDRSFTVVAQEDELWLVENTLEAGLRQLQVLNASAAPLEVTVGDGERFELAPGESSAWTRLTRDGAVLSVGLGEEGALQYQTPEPGASVTWTAVFTERADTLHQLGVLLLVESNVLTGDLELVTASSP